MRKYSLAILPGDGIGPEVMNIAVKVLDYVANLFDFEVNKKNFLVGGAAIDECGEALPLNTVSGCKDSDAILFGSVGGPKWENMPPEKQPERASLLPLRKIFGLYANIRPVIVYPSLVSLSPIKDSYIQDGLDMLIVRELTSGIYFGEPKKMSKDHALDTLYYKKSEIIRIAKMAFELASSRSKKVTSIDKANVLTSMVFWRKIVSEIGKEYPDVKLEHLYVDNAAMQLIKAPSQFDVVLTPNMFGDILSDEASILTGSLGMLPSASLNEKKFGLYEPAGGSAPDIVGQNLANPIAQILCVSMLLKSSFGLVEASNKIEEGIRQVLLKGIRTKDIAQGGDFVSTEEMGEAIIAEIK